MSLPTTIIIGADGDVAAINVGFASSEKLAEQLSVVGAPVTADAGVLPRATAAARASHV